MTNSKSKLIDRWYRDNEEEHGHYAIFNGFEKALKDNEDAHAAYYELDIYQQIAIYDFVTDLLEDEAKAWITEEKEKP